MDLNGNLTGILDGILTRMVKDLPTQEVFKPFRENPVLKYEDLSPQHITALIETYIHTPDTILAQRQYQEQFIKLFIKYDGEYGSRSTSLGRAGNILESTDPKDRDEIRAAVLQISFLMGSELTQSHISNVISVQSSINSPEKTAKLRAQLKQRKLLLVRGKSGNFDQLVSEDQLVRALDNANSTANFRSQFGEIIESFNKIPRRRDVSQSDASLLPVVIQAGTQSLSSDVADLQAQLLLQEGIGHLDFLQNQDFSLLANQVLIDAQTETFAAEMVDMNGDALLVRTNMLNEEAQYNMTFLAGEYARQIMTLTAQELENFRREELTARQMMAKVSQLRTAQQAEEEARRRSFDLARRQRVAQAQRGLDAAAFEIGQEQGEDSAIQGITDRIDQTVPEGFTANTPAHPSQPAITISASTNAEARVQATRQRLQSGKIITGTLQAKKALAAKQADAIRRQREAESSGRRDTQMQAQQAQAQEVSKGIALAAAGQVTAKKSKGARWIGGIFGVGTLGGASAFSFLDIVDLI